MKLLGSLRSPYVRQVLVVASETALATDIVLELHTVHLAAHTPEVMAFNPLNKLPTLIDDSGRCIFDSRVICEFLVWKSGRTDLLPADFPARISVLQRQALATGLIDLLILRLVELAKPQSMQWGDVVKSSEIKIAAVLDHLDTEAEVLREEGVTLGTLGLAVALNYIEFRFADLAWSTTRPGLSAWHREINLRPSLRDNRLEDNAPALAGKIR
ncbi:glutathione S-transferase [Hoeflea marina]|uniref:Glutathione S-transferase n=1 Tax=Hoeflea marina TaxID=274592 RepID=A0A317PH90_9HYPH|nr:glutathione S-transferase N-terminal domain-containing protein [Hoeflea marina]PWV98818.1 glutathione S-transferase [Hoeflea marina]